MYFRLSRIDEKVDKETASAIEQLLCKYRLPEHDETFLYNT